MLGKKFIGGRFGMIHKNIEKFFSSDAYDANLLSTDELLICWKYMQGTSVKNIAQEHKTTEEHIAKLLTYINTELGTVLKLKKELTKGPVSFPLTRLDYYLILSALQTVQKSYFFQYCHSAEDETWKNSIHTEIKKLCQLYELLQSGLFGKVIRPGILSWTQEDCAEENSHPSPIFPTISISDWIQDS